MTPAPSLLPLSVILCAHNPQPRHLQATLDSLRAQDLPRGEWELVVVDNLSAEPLAGRVDLSWHPNGRLVVESTLGLAHARRRGYAESRGMLVIHSDDDNILAPDYLRTAWNIRQAFPQIGAFGGQLVARFEEEPPAAVARSGEFAREFATDIWSNLPDDNRTMPFGAGMCLRREVVAAYLQQVEQDPRRLLLGRTGDRLITGEDIDLNYVAISAGYGTGLFAALSLVHLIPPGRMHPQHLIKYAAGNAYSMVLLHYLHTGEVRRPQRTRLEEMLFWVRVWLRMSALERHRETAMHRARFDAVRDMRKWGWLPPAASLPRP